MFCDKCASKAYEDSVFCHKCGTLLIRDEESADIPDTVPTVGAGDNVNYDIVLVEVADIESGATKEQSEKARMAVAYVLFEDIIKNINRGPEPDPKLKQQLQNESIKNADILISNLPAPIKKSVSKSEALFFKERLAQYGVIVILGYCPYCGGSLDDISDKCIACGRAAIELDVSDDDANITVDDVPKQAAQHTESVYASTALQMPAETDDLQASPPLAPGVREDKKKKRKKKLIIIASAVAVLVIAAVVIAIVFGDDIWMSIVNP